MTSKHNSNGAHSDMNSSPSEEKDAECGLIPADHSKKPWKYVGYRGFCRFAASDNDFLVLRRFGELGIRALLARQDELSELEDQLDTLETALMKKEATDVHNGTFRDETSETRVALMLEIDQKLRTYYKMLAHYSDIRSRPKPRHKDVESVSSWFFNQRSAISAPETEYITKMSDLVPIASESVTPLRQLLEKSSRFRLLGLWEKRSADAGHVHYLSDTRIDVFVNAITVSVGLTMLVAPLWILAFVTARVPRLSIITAFIVVFLPLVTFSSGARPSEALAATAGYAAVLVVFLQIAS